MEILNKASGFYAAGNIGWNILNPKDTISSLRAEASERAPKGPWRPPQWNNLTDDPEVLSLQKTNIAQTVMIKTEGSEYEGPGGGGYAKESETTYYFFDATFKEDHTTEVVLTKHPVQTGANVTDHAYVLPAKLVFEIGMSDIMDSIIGGQWDDNYMQEGVWANDNPRSRNAYQRLLQMQKDRFPLQVTTRLNTYQNMMIVHINAPDDYKTLYGLKCIVILEEIITADITLPKDSARMPVTGSTLVGTVQPLPPTSIQGAKLGIVEDDVKGSVDEMYLLSNNQTSQAISRSGNIVTQATENVGKLDGVITGIDSQAINSPVQLFNNIPDLKGQLSAIHGVLDTINNAVTNLTPQARLLITGAVAVADKLGPIQTTLFNAVKGVSLR